MSYLIDELQDKYVRRMQELVLCTDIEYAHGEADELLCEFIKEMGCDELIEIYYKVSKWHA
jgi:hypothetical protein